MTRQREWPNNMKNHRDRAAEEIEAALRQSTQLKERVQRGQFTRNGLELDIMEIKERMHVALRHLEKAGAETEPE